MIKLYVFIDNDGDLTAFDQRNPTVGAHNVTYTGMKSADISDRLVDFKNSWGVRADTMFRDNSITAAGISAFEAAGPRYVGSIILPA